MCKWKFLFMPAAGKRQNKLKRGRHWGKQKKENQHQSWGLFEGQGKAKNMFGNIVA